MRLLLHSCCAPCSTTTIEKLKGDYDITVIYYNPNIEPASEYLKRKKEQINFLNKINIPYLEIDYLNDEFSNFIKGYENEPEKGARCKLCFELRLFKTALIAKKNNFDCFATTLSVSPHKNTKIINEVGKDLAARLNIKYLAANFKSRDGYKRSLELSSEYNLYRQNYCGCRYSK